MNTPGRHKKTLPVGHPYDVSVDSANRHLMKISLENLFSDDHSSLTFTSTSYFLVLTFSNMLRVSYVKHVAVKHSSSTLAEITITSEYPRSQNHPFDIQYNTIQSKIV